jgi:hypothetical protein
MAALPYVTAPGNIEKALKAIKSAATPESVSQDFVKTILQIKGGSGNQVTSYLKKIGFANADGTPSEIYKKFRNPATEGKAAADALRHGYQPLFARNEYMYKLPDNELRGLIIEETGLSEDASVVTMITSCINSLKKYATWASRSEESHVDKQEIVKTLPPAPAATLPPSSGLGINLAYTINLNLPATSDAAVFNAIFKSLRETLLRGADGNG